MQRYVDPFADRSKAVARREAPFSTAPRRRVGTVEE